MIETVAAPPSSRGTTALARALQRAGHTKTMASIYHAFDAPFAPVESKVETVRSATKCCFAFDL